MNVYLDVSHLTDTQLLQHLLQFKQEEDKTLVLRATSEAHIEQIKAYIQQHRILYPIHLENKTHTPLQRELDELILNVRCHFYQQEQVQESSLPSGNQVRRTRPRGTQGNHQLDIDVEQQTEQEVVQEAAQEVVQEQETNAKSVYPIHFDAFKAIYRKHIPYVSFEAEALQLWHRVLATACIHEESGTDVSEVDAMELEKINQDSFYFPFQQSPHRQINGLTEKAAEIIIQHAKQFAYGLDWKHLPAGFQLIASPDNPKVYTLDYEPSVQYAQAPLAIQIIEPDPTIGIAASECEKLLTNAPTSQQRILSEVHEDLLKSEYYDSDDLALFRKHLPSLMHLDEEALTTLLRLSFAPERNCVDGKRLAFFLKNQKKMAQLRECRAENTIDFIWSEYYDGHVPLQESDFEVLAFSADASQRTFTCHPWAQHALQSELLQNLNAYYDFSWQQLNSLWHLQATRGEAGLLNVLQMLQKCQQEYPGDAHTFFTHVTDLSVLVKPEPYRQALVKIASFEESEKAWWLTLLEQHMATVGEDDILALVNAFNHFKMEVKKLGLSFYTPVAFQNIRSMPVALSRMHRILDNCNSDDLNAQWDCITALPLQSSGAIRAIEESSSDKPCGFVVPEMCLSALDYDYSTIEVDRSNRSIAIGYNTIATLNRMNSAPIMDMDDIEVYRTTGAEKIKKDALKELYRFLAWQPARGNLQFYQDAVAFWQAHPPSPSVVFPFTDKLYFIYLAKILAGGSTGPVNGMLAQQDPDKMLADFQKLLGFYNALADLPIYLQGLKSVLRVFLSGLIVELKFMPDFERMFILAHAQQKMCQSLQVNHLLLSPRDSLRSVIENLNIIKVFEVADTSEEMELLFESLRFLERLDQEAIKAHFINIRTLGRKLRGGHSLYNEDEEEESQLLDADEFSLFLQGNNSFVNGWGYIRVERTGFKALLPLISTFGITKENIETIETQLLKSDTATYALGLLRKVTKNEGLNLETLNGFLRSLPEDNRNLLASHSIDYAAVHELLRETFHDYFDEAFWAKLTGDALDSDCIDLIHQELSQKQDREACKAFFARFPKTAHWANLSTLFQQAATLGEHKAEFIQHVVTDNLFGINTENDLTTVLKIFSDSQHTRHWLYILRAISNKDTLRGEPAKTILKAWLQDITPMLEGERFARPLPASMHEVILNALHTALSSDDALLTPAVMNTPDPENTESPGFFSRLGGLFRYESEQEPPIEKDIAAIWSRACHLISNHPQSSVDLMKLIERLSTIHNPNWHMQLDQLCTFLEDQNDLTILALAIWFQEDRLDLLAYTLEHYQQYDDLDNRPELQATFFHILKLQANAAVDLTTDDLAILFDAQTLTSIERFYAQPPYPTLEQVKEWLQSDADLDEQYADFERQPCEREPSNGFHLNKAHEQRSALMEAPVQITDESLIQIHDQARAARSMTVVELKNWLQEAGKKGDAVGLVAAAAELMYRSMGRPGSSHEINATQYLAVYSLLNEQHITGQIASGEGKTRIFMLLAACQWAQGKTVDFVTRNMALASRDFLEYQAFFAAIDAQSALIHSDSPRDQYQSGSIHFSDVANLSLYRNQQRSCNEDNMDVPENRALLLDEADQSYFDAIDTRYNFATTNAQQAGDLTWIYPTLIDFFANEHHQALYYEDIDACNRAFRGFIRNQSDDATWAVFNRVEDKQIESWHDAAMEALSLRYQQDFIVSADEVMSIPGQGKQIYSRALVVKDNRVQRASSFANGVQQCLHARLNQLKEKELDNPLGHELQKTRYPFIVRPENSIVYSSTSKTFLDDYQDSTLIALTGTAGNIRERAEAVQLYRPQHQGGTMKFVDYPRHNKPHRYDMPMRLNRNRHNQIQAIIEDIKRAQEYEQPILIVCENDRESHALYQALEAVFGNGQLERIHAGTRTDDELKYVREKAGRPRQITISTDMIGRGTDPRLHEEAKSSGLHVIATYLPGERDLSQIINRAGRYGAKGSSRLILDRERLLKRTGLNALPWNFFTHNHVPERKMQDNMSQPQQLRRLLMFAVTDFQQQLQRLFFQNCPQEEGAERDDMLRKWTHFHRESTQLWEKYTHNLDGKLTDKQVTTNKVMQVLDDYGREVRELWQTYFAALPLVDEKPKISDVYDEVKQQHPSITASKKSFFHRYERAHDGFAVRYDHYFAQTRAVLRGERALFANTRAWLRGEGTIFANLKAFLRGEMSLSEYLFPVETKDCQDMFYFEDNTEKLPLEQSGARVPQINEGKSSDEEMGLISPDSFFSCTSI